MPGTFDDRALTEATEGALPRPQIEIIVEGNRVFKPPMMTYFVDHHGGAVGDAQAQVMGSYCTCDMVEVQVVDHDVTVVDPSQTGADGTQTPVDTCACEAHTTCTCLAVCTCETVCSCVSYQSCTCESVGGGGGGQWVSCGSPCACVPVH